MFVVVLVGISILWIPLIKAAQQGQLFLYIQALTGYIAPPICSVFLLAVFVPRVTEKVLAQVIKFPQYEFSISNTFEVRLLY